MIIKQISVFLENTAGRIADVTRILKEGGINLKNDLLSIDELVENIDDLLKGQ